MLVRSLSSARRQEHNKDSTQLEKLSLNPFATLTIFTLGEICPDTKFRLGL